MKRILLSAALLITVVSIGYSLPPDIQADQYLIAAKSCIDEGDYREAADFFDKILNLNVPVPNQFHYHYACTLKGIHNHREAKNEILQYLELAGRGGEYYIDALKLLNELEELLQYRRLLVKTEHYEIDDNYSGDLSSYQIYSYNSQGQLIEEKNYWAWQGENTLRSLIRFRPTEQTPTIKVGDWIYPGSMNGYFSWEGVPTPVPAEKIYYYGKNGQDSATTRYNQFGNQLKYEENTTTRTYTYTYDDKNRILQSSYIQVNSDESYNPGTTRGTLRFKYVAGVQVPSTAQCRVDESGRLTRVVCSSGDTYSFTYTVDGQVSEAIYSDSNGSRTSRYTYNNRGQVQEVVMTATNQKRSVLTMEYDEEGYPIKIELYTPNRTLEDRKSYRVILKYDDIKVSGE